MMTVTGFLMTKKYNSDGDEIPDNLDDDEDNEEMQDDLDNLWLLD